MTAEVPVLAPEWEHPRPLKETAYDRLADLPAGWRYGSGLEHNHKTAQRTTAEKCSEESPSHRSGPSTFGSERHPSMHVTNIDAPGGVDLDGWQLHRCRHGDRPKWRIGFSSQEFPTWLYRAADGDGAVRLSVYGTREGDTWNGEVDIERISAATDGGMVLQVGLPPGENPTLFRLAATGCLLCRGRGGRGE